MERNLKINLNAFESAYLLAFIYRAKNDRDSKVLRNVLDQLQSIEWKIKEDAGVKVEKLPNGLVKLTDKYGNMIIRTPYEWERSIFSAALKGKKSVNENKEKGKCPDLASCNDVSQTYYTTFCIGNYKKCPTWNE